MTPEQKERTFFFEGNPVGYFLADTLPNKPGRHKYMPYRGPGHYNLGQSLIAKGPQHCELLVEKKSHKFLVQCIPEYGVVEVAKFE